MGSDLSSVRLSEKNIPLDNNKNTPLVLAARTYHSSYRRYTNPDSIIDIAIGKFRKSQHGVTFKDLMKQSLAVHKRQAQDTLKYYRRKGTLFTLKLRRPQEYFASIIKSEVMESISPKITPIDPTGVTHNYYPHNSSVSPLSSYPEAVTIESLEGYILPLLKAAPSYIHNLHFKTKITTECYTESDIQKLPDVDGNKGKRLLIIGNAGIVYTFYPSGTVNIEVKCSNNPFKLETEIDRSHILVFIGQLRDRLIAFLNDPHERIIPDIMEWFLTECDINRDIKVSDSLHYTWVKIQVKHLDHLFRIYVKSMDMDTVCRVEEGRHSNRPVIEAINDIFNPYERIEKELAAQGEVLRQIRDKLVQEDF